MQKLKSILYWITGLSGAGKTTIGNRLYYELKKRQDNIVILDGDILKTVFSEVPGYSRKERQQRAMKYAKMCKSLTDQGLVVICCTIAMFDNVREWNRKNNRGYVEIFINTPMETLKRRDQKGIYSGYHDGILYNIAGQDIDVEFPQNPDIEIINDETNDLEECVKRILAFEVCIENDYCRDRKYWNTYYKKGLAPKGPSCFAKVIGRYLEKDKQILELGCGNGRDSLFFSKLGLRVTSIDASDVVIDKLQKYIRDANIKNIWFLCDDFVNSSLMKTQQYDYIYSRFTLHSINAKQQGELFHNVKNALKKGGIFLLRREVFTIRCMERE